MVLGRTNLAMKDETKGAEFGNADPSHVCQQLSSCSRVSLNILTGMTCYRMNRRDVEGTHEVQRTSYSLTRWCWRK